MSEQESKPADVDAKSPDLRNLPIIAGTLVVVSIVGGSATYLSGLWGQLPDRLKNAVVAWLPIGNNLPDTLLRSGFDDSSLIVVGI